MIIARSTHTTDLLSRQRPRMGITLTEILISIMIMGLGLVSIATLFPLGLVRIRDAMRNTRSTQLARSSLGELEARNLLAPESFFMVPWYPTTAGPRDVWIQDVPTIAMDPGVNSRFTLGAPSAGPGLAVAYDPLFWSMLNQSNPAIVPDSVTFRLGDGNTTGMIRDDQVGSPTVPSAYGVQRITNFVPWNYNAAASSGFYITWPLTHPSSLAGSSLQAQDIPAEIFTSQDDVVFQSIGDDKSKLGTGSPLVPDMSSVDANGQPTMMRDWAFSWMFTGRQTISGSTSSIEGDLVIFHNRSFAATTNSLGNAVPVGEEVLEAVWGYSKSNIEFTASVPSGVPTSGYARGSNRTVLLRWPVEMPDPEIKVGSWIADVTYERNEAVDTFRFSSPAYSSTFAGQRCFWYQVVKRTEPQDATAYFGGESGGPLNRSGVYREMIVQVNTDLQAKTRLNASGQPVFVNVALFIPWVVNVFPKVVSITDSNPMR